MRIYICLVLCICSFTLYGDVKVFKPFPQAGLNKYYGAVLKLPQDDMNQDLKNFYDHWKSKYLVESTINKGDYKIIINKKGVTVSEAMGYGMLITVQMAGYDPNAKKYFDGLNSFRKRFPSKFNKSFMCWTIKHEDRPKRDDSATDGDLDMAAALLMASIQWGDPTYHDEAVKIINAAEQDLIRKDFSLRLGDWDSDEEKVTAVRPSDFATANFELFARETGHDIWLKVKSRCYEILEELQTDYAQHTGLIPDFAIMGKDGKWHPAKSNFLETKHDGAYYYNSCRVPWRLAISVLIYNDSKAESILTPLMKWVVSTIPEPRKFKAGYALNGKPLEKFDEAVYTSPVVLAAMALGYDKWALSGFKFVKNYKVDYFSDSINLLSMMALTHNYWMPEQD